jgi:hypothetical protein
VAGVFTAIVVVTGAVVGIVVALSGSGAVVVTNVPTPDAAGAAACRKLSTLLPEAIGDGLHSRTVKPNSPLLHAWGTPAAVLRRGVGLPPNYDPTAGAGEIDHIVWYRTALRDATVFTAINRTPMVSVAIPNHYQSSFDILVSLSSVLKQATKPA